MTIGYDRKSPIPEWDLNFFDINDKKLILDVIKAAHFMDIKSMATVGCRIVGEHLKTKVCISKLLIRV
jgi:hypothetical protein